MSDFFLKCLTYIICLFVRLCQSEAHGVPKTSENNLQDSVFSFDPMDPRDGSLVI